MRVLALGLLLLAGFAASAPARTVAVNVPDPRIVQPGEFGPSPYRALARLAQGWRLNGYADHRRQASVTRRLSARCALRVQVSGVWSTTPWDENSTDDQQDRKALLAALEEQRSRVSQPRKLTSGRLNNPSSTVASWAINPVGAWELVSGQVEGQTVWSATGLYLTGWADEGVGVSGMNLLLTPDPKCSSSRLRRVLPALKRITGSIRLR